MLLEEKLFYRELEAKMEGEIKGVIGSVIALLEDFGTIPVDLLTAINAETDLDKLKKWHKTAARANSIEEFMEKMREYT